MCTQPALDGLGELDHVPGALDVGDPLRLGVRGHVVDRREVEEVVDLALAAARGPRRRRPSLGSERSPTIGDDAVVVGAPAVAQLLQAALRALADEHVDRPLALEQQLDQVAADEPGCAGYEVAHCVSSIAADVWREPTTWPMAFELAPDPGDRGEPDVKQGRTGGSAVGEDRAWSTTGSRCSPAARSSARRARCRSRRRRGCARGRRCAAGSATTPRAALEFLREDVVRRARERRRPRRPGRLGPGPLAERRKATRSPPPTS